MPSVSNDPTLNAAAHEEGKPFRLADFFSTLLGGAGRNGAVAKMVGWHPPYAC